MIRDRSEKRWRLGRSETAGCSSSAFTVLELVVSMAVILVILGMTLTALSSARNAALAAKCRMHLRECLTSLAAYTNDSRQRLPMLSDRLGERSFENAGYALAFGLQSLYWPMRVVLADSSSGPGISPVQFCPGSLGYAEHFRGSTPISDYPPAWVYPAQFELAHAAFTDSTSFTSSRDATVRARNGRMDEIVFPSHKGLLVERRPRHLYGGRATEPNSADLRGPQRARHAFPTAFADGSIDSVAYGRFLAGVRPGGALAGAPVLQTRDGLRGRDLMIR